MRPILELGPFGLFVLGIEIQKNLSSYYHTPLRDIFVGAMCAIGIFLFCYHGYDGLYLATRLTLTGSMTLMGIHLFLLPDSFKAILNKFNFIFWMK